MTIFDDVGDFHRKFGLPSFPNGKPELLVEDVAGFRIRFMQEELAEFIHSHKSGDLAGAADALCDLVYVALGTAHMMHIPFDDCWREVQRANMTKVRANGADDPLSKRGHRLDVVKPPGFKPPDLDPILERAANLVDVSLKMSRLPEDWDRWLLGLARYVATASKDPSTKVGAVVVGPNDRRRIAFGYNGFPPRITDDHRLNDRAKKYPLIMHAERNALDNATFDVVGGTLYCTLPPCIECTKSIVSKQIRRVVVPSIPAPEEGRWTEQIQVSLEILSEAGVSVVVVNG